MNKIFYTCFVSGEVSLRSTPLAAEKGIENAPKWVTSSCGIRFVLFKQCLDTDVLLISHEVEP